MILLNAITWMLKKTLGESNRGLRCMCRKFVSERLGCRIDSITGGKYLMVEISNVR